MGDQQAAGAAGWSVVFRVEREAHLDAVALPAIQPREGQRGLRVPWALQGAADVSATLQTTTTATAAVRGDLQSRLLCRNCWMVKVQGGQGRSHLHLLPVRAVVDPEPGTVGVLGDQRVVAVQVDNQSAGISTEDDARTARVSWSVGGRGKEQEAIM